MNNENIKEKEDIDDKPTEITRSMKMTSLSLKILKLIQDYQNRRMKDDDGFTEQMIQVGEIFPALCIAIKLIR